MPFIPEAGGEQPEWSIQYKESMYRGRTPGWIICLVMVCHLVCCSKVCKPWIERARFFASPVQKDQVGSGAGPAPPPADLKPEPSFAPPNLARNIRVWDVLSKDPMTVLVEFAVSAMSEPTAAVDEQPAPGANDPAEESCSAPDKAEVVLPTGSDIAALMGISAFSFLLSWTPSTHLYFSRGVWAVGSGAAACLSICTFALVWMGRNVSPRVATCAAMHASAQHILSVWQVCCLDCPSPLKCVGSSGIIGDAVSRGVCAMSLAALLFHISHHPAGHGISGFDELQFYSSHVWGLIFVECIRAAAYFPVLELTMRFG